jgi:hypothetical protein
MKECKRISLCGRWHSVTKHEGNASRTHELRLELLYLTEVFLKGN